MFKIKLITRVTLLALVTMPFLLHAEQNEGVTGKRKSSLKKLAAECDATTSTVFLDVNNVRAMLQVGGDLWWDANAIPYYEIPKVEKGSGDPVVSSIFSGALWIGGVDPGGALKIAAQTYRQTGNDFWGGPLDNNATIDDETCKDFDKHWKVNREDIIAQKAKFEGGATSIGLEEVPKAVKEWPANGNRNSTPAIDFGKAMAPFFDADGDGFYDPTVGDYPVLDPATPEAIPDQMIFWVFNDRGNIHTETGADAIGLEIQALAFAFATNDEVNDMTFYKFKVINRATTDLDSTFFGVWVDPDLGCFNNDYVGCVPELDLGICYNGTAVDDPCGQSPGYGANPPMVGVDYFRGPIGNDGETPLKMSSFLYYNNDGTVTGNPRTASDFYNYLSGSWRDGSPFQRGGDGYQEGGDPYNFIFDSDPSDNSVGAWSECSENNTAADRRFLQSAGPFKLKAGAVNDVVIGVIWVRPEGDPCTAGFDLIKKASSKAQALFDNNFKLVDGPDAPDLVIRELDRELIITLRNGTDAGTHNNYRQSYEEVEPTIAGDVALLGQEDSFYVFQGYKVFQVIDATVTPKELAADILDPERARLIAQFDIRDGVGKIINFDEEEGRGIVPNIMVDGNDNGIQHSLKVTQDAFATGADKILINHQTYYFTAIAYAYNNYKAYDPNDPLGLNTTVGGQNIVGQKQPYLEGRNNIEVYTAIPHIPIMENGGTVLNSVYGDAPYIHRLEGQGNGDRMIEFTEESTLDLFESSLHRIDEIIYELDMAPIDVKVVDPMKVTGTKYELRLDDVLVYETITGDAEYIPAIGDLIKGDSGRTATITRVTSSTSDGDGGGNFLNSGIVAVDMTSPADSGVFRDMEVLVINTTDTVNCDGGLRQSSGWTLWDETDSKKYVDANDMLIEDENEQIIYDRRINSIEPVSVGISIRLKNGVAPGTFKDITVDNSHITGNGLISSEQTFEDVSKTWMWHIPDNDGQSILNWIRAGTADDSTHENGAEYSDYGISGNPTIFYDEDQVYEEVLDGGFAPFMLAYHKNHAPGYDSILPHQMSLGDLASINLVMTPDKSMWTRSVVVETNDNPLFSEGGREKLDIRSHGSWIDKTSYDNDGLPLYSQVDEGMGYFPGYAVNMETGVRLNIIYGESSWLKIENGGDMMWNPTGEFFSQTRQYKGGGKHFIYIMNTRYDEGVNFQNALLNVIATRDGGNAAKADSLKRDVWRNAMWVTQPMVTDVKLMLPMKDGYVPTPVTTKIRVSKPFDVYSINGENEGRPVYGFDMTEYAVDTNQSDVAENALDLIKVVPNPYYAYSDYEKSAIDNRVKFTNLPARCIIRIYSLDGRLIRTYERDDASITSLDWDLKNQKSIPIASGTYLIHINAPDLGEERILKWFGVMRPLDLDTF